MKTLFLWSRLDAYEPTTDQPEFLKKQKKNLKKELTQYFFGV
jgi:hypothetical protein